MGGRDIPRVLDVRADRDRGPLWRSRVGLISGVLLVLRWVRGVCLRLGGHADAVGEVGLGHESRPFAGGPGTRQGMPTRRGRAWQGDVGSAAGVPGSSSGPDLGGAGLRAVPGFVVRRGTTVNTPARRDGGLDPQDGQLRDVDARRMPRTGWSAKAVAGGLNASPELEEQSDATSVEPPTAYCQESAATDDGSAQADFRRVRSAVMAVLVRSRREGRSRSFVLCGRHRPHGVGVSWGPAFGARVSAAGVGEEVHQAESEEQQEEQPTDCPSPCLCSVAHMLRHPALASS